MRAKERIPLADVVQAYFPTTANPDAVKLTNSIIDLQTLVQYTHSSFPKVATVLDYSRRIFERR